MFFVCFMFCFDVFDVFAVRYHKNVLFFHCLIAAIVRLFCLLCIFGDVF